MSSNAIEAIEDLTFKCASCYARTVVKPTTQSIFLDGGVSVTVAPPVDWKLSFGSNGRGCYALCPSCRDRYGIENHESITRLVYIGRDCERCKKPLSDHARVSDTFMGHGRRHLECPK